MSSGDRRPMRALYLSWIAALVLCGCEWLLPPSERARPPLQCPDNQAPVAEAGPDQDVDAGTQVTLDARASDDPDADVCPNNELGGSLGGAAPLTYAWRQVSGPTVTLTDADLATPQFDTTGIDGALVFEVTVTDTRGGTDSDTVTVTVATPPPVLDAVELVGFGGLFGRTSGTASISVTVLDTDGHLISSGLSASNFSFRNVSLRPQAGGSAVTANATATGITVVPPSQEGSMTAVLVFDTSGSMGEGPDETWNHDIGGTGRRAGGNAFIDHVQPGDHVAVTHFAYSATLVQDFTDDRTLLRAALSSFDDYGGTALWDACLDALRRIRERSGTRGAIVVLTDGQDMNSSHSSQEVVAQANSQATQVFMVGLGAGVDFTTLQQIAQGTGGAFASASDADALGDVFAGISTGATIGFVRVEAAVTYPSQPSGLYHVAGELVTTVGSESIVTPIDTTVPIP
jgi:uncharacterized protein YegL